MLKTLLLFHVDEIIVATDCIYLRDKETQQSLQFIVSLQRDAICSANGVI